MMRAGETADIERTIHIDARPERVFSFLTDPARMIRWMGLEARLEPRPGGLYSVNIDGQNVAEGQYLEVSPPSRVVFTFGWRGPDSPLPPGSSTVEFVLESEGDGTRLHFRHFGLPEAIHEHQARGWDHYLQRLVIVAAGGDPGPDPFASGRMGQ